MKGVVIVGAGIVGLVAAKEIAGRGIDVEVYDQKRRVEDNADKASGILSKEGLAKIGLAYENSMVNTLKGAVLHAGGEKLRIRAKEDKAYVLDRKELAKECYEAAKDAGARITLGRRLERRELRELDDGSRIIIGADGAVSAVASAFGFPGIREYALTYKKTYSNANVDDKSMVELFFYNKMNRFFGWSAPYSDSVVELGVGVSSRARISSVGAFSEFMKLEEVNGLVKGARPGTGYASMIPLETRKSTVKGNVLLVGDAAGQVKATTGGGIIFGSLCAKIAADSVERHIKSGAPLDRYENEWKKRYGTELRMHRLVHEYYSSLSSRNFEAFIRIARMLGAEAFFGKYGDMDRPSAMIKRFFLRSLVGDGKKGQG